MNSVRIFCLCIVLLLQGCCSSSTGGKINAEYKQRMGELRITPIMPLREKLEIGEVFMYLDKPPAYSDDGPHIEPLTAFTIDLKTVKEEACVFPTITLKESSSESLAVSAQAFGLIKGRSSSIEDVTINAIDVESKSVEIAAFMSELVRTNADGVHVLQEKYIEKLVNFVRHFREAAFFKGKPWKQNQVWIRIPLRIYSAGGMIFSVNHKKNREGTFVLGTNDALATNAAAQAVLSASQLANLATATFAWVAAFQQLDGNLALLKSTETSIALKEKFPKPLSIGYRGVLLRVWLEGVPANPRQPQYRVEWYFE